MKSKTSILGAAAMLSPLLLLMHCTNDDAKTAGREQLIFPRGEPGPATNFTGKAYNFGLVPSDSTYNTLVGTLNQFLYEVKPPQFQRCV